jgi:hypothetical protein
MAELKTINVSSLLGPKIKLPKSGQEEVQIEEDKPGFFKSFFSGVGSGLIKIPEGVASLGAELIDLGFDTDKAAEVEAFFDDLNPFEETAEKTLTGKLTEGIIQLGIPGTAGFKIGSKLAKGAINAKKSGTSLNINKAKNIKKKQLGEAEKRIEEIAPKGPTFRERLITAAGSIGGATLGESVAFDQSLGTIGDVIGGPTRTDDTKDLTGGEEAARRLSNRFKFAIESGLIGAGIGTAITGIKTGVKATPLARAFNKDPLQSKLGQFINSLTPNGGLSQKLYEILQLSKEGVSEAALLNTTAADNLQKAADTLVKNVGRLSAAEKESKLNVFKNLIDKRLKNFGDVDEKDIFLSPEGELLPKYKFSDNEAIANNQRLSKERLDNFIKNQLKGTDKDIADIEQGVRDYRSQIDINTKRMINIADEVMANQKVIMEKGLSDEAAKVAGKMYDSAKRFRDAAELQLGKYITIDYEVFKDQKGLLAGLLGKQFMPSADVQKEAIDLFEFIIAKSKATPDMLSRATKIVNDKFPKLSAQAKQKKIDNEILRMQRMDDGAALRDQATNAVATFLQTRGRSFFDPSKFKGKEDFLTNFQKQLQREGIDLDINKGILKQRTLKNPTLKKLFGEIEDPYFNYVNTTTKQAENIAMYKAYDDMYRATTSVTRDPKTGKAITRSDLFFDTEEELLDYVSKRKAADDQSFADFSLSNPREDIVQINTNGPLPTALDGKYTFKPVADVIQNAPKAIGDNVFSNIYKYMILIPKSFSQQAKTLYSPFTHVRNVLSATLFTTMQGNIFFQNPAKTVRNFKNAFKDITGSSTEALKKRLRYQRLGIMGTNPIAGDIDALSREVGTNFYEGNIDGVLGRLAGGFGKLAKGARDAYLAEDNFWKIYNFESELDSLRSVFKDIPADQITSPKNRARISQLLGRRVSKDDPIFTRNIDITPDGKFYDLRGAALKEGSEELKETFLENMAANITKNNIPNYEYVGEFIKTLRRLPLGTFIAFPAEIIRTGFNTIQRGLREIKTPGFENIGRRRLAGALTTSMLIPAGAVKFGQSISDVSDEELQALRSFVPSWAENSILVPTEKGEDGKITYMDLSYIFPYDTLVRPITTVLNEASKGIATEESINKYLLDAGIKSMAELAKPFMSESIFFEAFGDLVLRNGRSRDERQVFKPGDTVGEKLQKGTMHITETFMPGSVGQIGRLFKASGQKVPDKYGQVYDLADEVPGIFGFRRVEADPAKSLPFVVTDFQNLNSSARSSFIGDVGGGGLISPGEIVQQYIGSERVRFQNFKNMAKIIQDAKTLGISNATLNKELNRLPKATRNALLQNKYVPYKPSTEVFKIFNENFRQLQQDLGRPVENPFPTAAREIFKLYRENYFKNLDDEAFLDVELPAELYRKEQFVPSQPVTPTQTTPTIPLPTVSGSLPRSTLDPVTKKAIVGDMDITEILAERQG